MRGLKINLLAARVTRVFIAFFLLALFISSVSASDVAAVTTLPTRMNFQGRLVTSSGAIVPNGTYNMRFRIWNGATGGVQQWSEDRLVSAGQGVVVTNGQFSVLLGSVNSLPASVFTSNSLFFEVELPTLATATSTSPSWTEGAMTPRSQLATSAYAYNAETLDGIDGDSFAQLGISNAFTGTNTFSGANVSVSGAAHAAKFNVANLFNVDSANSVVSIGTVDATGTVLVLDTKNTAGDPAGTNGAMYYNSSLGRFRCYENNSWNNCISSMRSFLDTTPNAVVDNNTSSYWNTAAENNNSVPNISLATTSNAIYGTVTVEALNNTTNDLEFGARIERGIGSVPACGSGTVVGPVIGNFSTNIGARPSTTVTFIDTPATSQPVYYTVCADTSTVIDSVAFNPGSGSVTRIRVSLQETRNSN
jgi:hypothetical protein